MYVLVVFIRRGDPLWTGPRFHPLTPVRFQACLLHQKLHMVHVCIVHKLARDALRKQAPRRPVRPRQGAGHKKRFMFF